MKDTEFLTRIEQNDRVLLVVHRLADRDAIASAVALEESLRSATQICTPEGVKVSARSLLRDNEVVTNPQLSEYDAIVIVDSPSRDRIRPLDPTASDAECFLIDHHTPGDLATIATGKLIDTEPESAAEIVYRAMRAADRDISPTAAVALVAGLLAATRNLARAGEVQVSHLANLLSKVQGKEDVLAQLYPPPQADGKRMAKFKGAIRSEGYQAGETVIAFTDVGGNESDAANALMDAGADCVFVLSEQGDHTRVVGRCTDSFGHRLSLGGELFPLLAENGGGHETAGTVRLYNEKVAEAKNSVLQSIEQELGVVFGEVS